MSLIAMAVYCTALNNRDSYFHKTLEGLSETVDFSKHRLGISINGHTEETLDKMRIAPSFHHDLILESLDSFPFQLFCVLEKVVVVVVV